jgi:hypothetical protein
MPWNLSSPAFVRRGRPSGPAVETTRFSVVIPARNEETLRFMRKDLRAGANFQNIPEET